MSWTRRITHPSELVQVDDEIEVVVLKIDKEKHEISLGMKQTQENPWDRVADRYPPGAIVKGTVRNLTNYGAFIEIEEGIDGLLHVSDMSWTRKISHPNEMVEKGQVVECRVLCVDQERRRIALGMKQLNDDPWATDIPGKYQPGQIVKGPVTKITNFGVFVGLEDGLEGLLAHLRAGGPQGREPRGRGQGRAGDRSQGAARRCRRAEDRPLAEAGRVGRGRRRRRRRRRRATPSKPQPSIPPAELKGGVGGGSGPLISPRMAKQEGGE